MKKILWSASLIVLSLVFSGITYAGQTTGTLQVSATVVGVCTVITSPVNFGNTDGSTAVLATGDVTANCPAGTTYFIALDAGQHYDTVQGVRTVMSGSYAAQYLIHAYPTENIEWGDLCPVEGGAGTYQWGACVVDTGSGSNQSHTAYGYLNTFSGIPGGTTLTDTVTVTVLF
jgi:spore coat protein U-like protein